MLITHGTIAIIFFIGFTLVVALIIASMLLHGFRVRESIFSKFSQHVGEFIIVLSKERKLQDVYPKFSDDVLNKKIRQEGAFKDLLSPAEQDRLEEYLKSASAYPNIPFIFTYESDYGRLWYELRVCQYGGGRSFSGMAMQIKNVTKDVDTKNHRDSLQENLEMLLKNTGDFLWSFDVDTRKVTLLTPITDDEGRVVPRSLGEQDVQTLLPIEEFKLFEKRINARIVEFRANNKNIDDNANIKMRMYGPNGKLVWYSFRCKLYLEGNSKIVVKGVARRMDLLFESPVFENDASVDTAIAAMLSFPDMRVFCVDRDYRVVSCNQTFAVDFQYTTPKDIIGRRLLEVVRPKYFSFMQGVLTEIFENGKPKSWKGPFVAEGKVLWLNAIPIRRVDGFSHRILCVYMHMNEKDFFDSKKEFFYNNIIKE
ncbi:MAG: PAS domain-containing protein [Fibrobacter sp.]|nr:PAS domain-containing protein [Fibrobacter sp.]